MPQFLRFVGAGRVPDGFGLTKQPAQIKDNLNYHNGNFHKSRPQDANTAQMVLPELSGSDKLTKESYLGKNKSFQIILC